MTRLELVNLLRAKQLRYQIAPQAHNILVDPVGVEPISAGLQGQLASRVHASPKFFVALSGLEPEFPT